METVARSLVAIFDIEAFSTRNASQQAELVGTFVDGLNKELLKLAPLAPDAFSTGDGAIISIGRRTDINDASLKTFMDFVVQFMSELLTQGIIVRTAVNYSEHDQVMALDPLLPLQGGFIQVGHTVNDAARILTFAEPREILVSQSLVRLLRDLDLEHLYDFVENEPFMTKHKQILNTFTFDPPRGRRQVFYRPDSPVHPYKRFSSFPPVGAQTLQYFMGNGLDLELRKVITSAYDALQAINETMSFISWNAVLKVLIQLKYDPTDRVYVLSRNDQPGFWTQSRKREYLNYLDANSKAHGAINQVRVVVYDDIHETDDMLPPDDILLDLQRMHAPHTLFRFPAGQLFRYETLSSLRYGFTLSRKHRYAIVPVPAPEGADFGHFSADRIAGLLQQHPDYDPIDGPMKAIITADARFITKIVKEMDSLLKDQLTAITK